MNKRHLIFWWIALLGLLWFAGLWYSVYNLSTVVVYLVLAAPWGAILILWLSLVDEREAFQREREECRVRVRPKEGKHAL